MHEAISTRCVHGGLANKSWHQHPLVGSSHLAVVMGSTRPLAGSAAVPEAQVWHPLCSSDVTCLDCQALPPQ
jgi:hypothetical protein